MFFRRKPVLPIITECKIKNNVKEISTKVKCKNCSKYFEADDDSSCYFHPGKLVSDGLRTSNFYDELRYECCGKIQKGFNPILEEPKGCKMNKKHVRL